MRQEDTINDYPVKEGAGFRMDYCYCCGKGDLIDARGLCALCAFRLIDKIKEVKK